MNLKKLLEIGCELEDSIEVCMQKFVAHSYNADIDTCDESLGEYIYSTAKQFIENGIFDEDEIFSSVMAEKEEHEAEALRHKEE